MDAMLRALSDGTRRQILTLVWREERTAGDIAAKFAMTRPSVSQHLSVLLDSELVSVRRGKNESDERHAKRDLPRGSVPAGSIARRH
jgi:DNA-binding transcriptional ArsR family regulator